MSLIPKYKLICKYCHTVFFSDNFKEVCDNQMCREKENQYIINRLYELGKNKHSSIYEGESTKSIKRSKRN